MRYNLFTQKYREFDFFDSNFCNLSIDYIQLIKFSDEDLPNLKTLYANKLSNIKAEIENNSKLSTFIRKFNHLEYKSKINLFNSFEYIKFVIGTEKEKTEKILIDFLSTNLKLIKTQINFIDVNDYLIPFDNLLLFSLYSLYQFNKNNIEIFQYMNQINDEIITQNIINKTNEYFDNCEIDFFIYKNQDEINNNLIEPQFIKTKSSFYLPFGAFSNIFSKMVEKHNLKNVSEIDEFIKENKNNLYLLSIENNPKDIYKIVQNNSFIKHFLSEDSIIRNKKYIFNKNYWLKMFNSLIDALPFVIPEKDKMIEILYDNENFRVVKISSNIINLENKMDTLINKLIAEKSINSRTFDIAKIQEEMILSNIIDIKRLLEKYEYDKTKLKNCSIKTLNIIKSIDYTLETDINYEITNKNITNKLDEINNLIKFRSSFLEQSLIIIKNGSIDIFSTARSVRTFIELISKMFIIDQVFKCIFNIKNNEKVKYNTKIFNLSKKLNIEIASDLLKISISPNLNSIDEKSKKFIEENKKEFEILHLKYHLDKFNEQFNFPKTSFGFTKEIYTNFILELLDCFDKDTLNIFAHSFYWFHNDFKINELSTKIIDGLSKLIDLLKTENCSNFITQLNSIYEFLSNKDNSLEKFFNTTK